MKTEHLHQHYNDLLPANADEESVHVVRDLHTLYATAPAPDHINAAIARAVQQRKVEHAQRPSQRRGFLGGWQLRTVGMVAALLLAFLIGGGVYALGPILDQAFDRFKIYDPGMRYVLDNDLYQDVDLSQTIDGYTVHVQRVYADVNRIIVGYTLVGPEDKEAFTYTTESASVIMADGTELQAVYNDQPIGQDNNIGSVLSFDMPEQYIASDVAVQFVIKDVDLYAPIDPRQGENGLRKLVGTVADPFVFDLAMPVHTGRVAEVNQTITVNDVPVTLERVVVAPSSTRVQVRYHDVPGRPVAEWGWEGGYARLSVDGWDADQESAEGSGNVDGARHTYNRQYALFDKRGEWVYTIDNLWGWDPVKTAAMKEGDTVQGESIEGPWEFKFIVP